MEGQQDEAGVAYDPNQPQEAGEYYGDPEEGYQEEAIEEEEDEIARMMKGRGRKKAYEKSFAQISAEVGSTVPLQPHPIPCMAVASLPFLVLPSRHDQPLASISVGFCSDKRTSTQKGSQH